ncbi:MAG: acyl-CoA thioesterase [Flavobacteriaceae bacterium]|nr:acyl-CoA thioesterase [Flavobacteriaceae bacterium]|tara:strand:- start:36296 stop:36802 length:507 start_codon:yes stop_codon:yes gene_type:complete
MNNKTPKDSLTTLTDSVLPGETNALNNLFGGELLARMDRAASISAKRHSEEIVVTSSVNHVSFSKAIPIGTTVTIEAKVSRAFNTSMEVFIDVWVDDEKGKKIKANEAIYTFVAVDKNGRPTQIDKIFPETIQEKKRYDAALRRKQLSLVLAGKMEADDATELKALFS